jgi:hypothetical protein
MEKAHRRIARIGSLHLYASAILGSKWICVYAVVVWLLDGLIQNSKGKMMIMAVLGYSEDHAALLRRLCWFYRFLSVYIIRWSGLTLTFPEKSWLKALT